MLLRRGPRSSVLLGAADGCPGSIYVCLIINYICDKGTLSISFFVTDSHYDKSFDLCICLLCISIFCFSDAVCLFFLTGVADFSIIVGTLSYNIKHPEDAMNKN